MRFSAPLLAILSILALSALLSGCGGDADYKPIDFSKTVAIAHPDPRPAQENVLRVAVAAMISPKETFIYYRELLDYLGRKSDHSIANRTLCSLTV